VERERQFSALPSRPSIHVIMTLRVAFLISLPWQPPARNMIAGRTSYTGSNVRHPSHATLQYFGHEETASRRTDFHFIAWAEVADVCAIRDWARVDRGGQGLVL
jgi:hypothetical protein